MANESNFEGNPGVLAAITFVILEMIRLPLFEYTRESLTIAIVRCRAAEDKKVKLCSERSIAVALGLSDGLCWYSSYAIVPRVLKIFFKVSLVVSSSVWEFQLDAGQSRRLVSYHFNDRGPSGPKNESSVMFPLPFTGLPELPVSRIAAHQGNAKRKSFSLEIIDIGFDFLTHCILAGDN